MKIVWMSALLIIPTVYGAEHKRVSLPPIKNKIVIKSRLVLGKTEYLIRPGGQKVTYWLDQETIQQLADLEEFKSNLRKAVRLGLSYNQYMALKNGRLLREQAKPKRI